MDYGVLDPDTSAGITGDLALAALDALPDHLAVLDESSTIIYTNAAWRRFARNNGWLDQGAGIGWNYLAICDAAAADGFPEAAAAANWLRMLTSYSRNGSADRDDVATLFTEDRPGELYPCHSPVEQRWFRVSFSRLPAAGSARVLVRHDNVTAQQLADAAEEQARASAALAERQYRQVFLAGGDPVIVTDAAGRILDANPAACNACSIPLPLLRDRQVVSLVNPAQDGGPTVASILTSNEIDLDEGWRGELHLRSAMGNDVPVEAVVTSVASRGSKLIIWVMRDLSAMRELAQMQRDFVGLVSHELKGPLTGIKGFAQLMSRRERYNPVWVDAMLEQSRALERLIDDLMDATRAETGQLRIDPTRVDLKSFLESLVTQVRLTTDQHTISLSLPDAPVVAEVDPARLNQVVLNLMTNAVKYSPDGGAVDVGLETGNGLVSITIRDSGVGIAPELLPRLFDRFYRVPGQIRDRVAGLGLGLYLCKAIVDAHGGAILVSSTVGGGSTFTVQLPLRYSE